MPTVPAFQGANSTMSATSGKVWAASDTSVIEPMTRAIMIGGAGNLAVEYADGVTHTITSPATGVMHAIQARRQTARTHRAATLWELSGQDSGPGPRSTCRCREVAISSGSYPEDRGCKSRHRNRSGARP